jgi:hypothetical protein
VSVGIQRMSGLEVGFALWSSMCTLCVEEFRRKPGRPVSARGSTGKLHPRTRMCQLHRGTTWCTVRFKVTFGHTRCMVGLQILYAVVLVGQRSGTEKVGRTRLSEQQKFRIRIR